MIIYWAVIKKRKQKVCFDSKGNAHRFSVFSFSLPCSQFRGDQVTSWLKILSPLKNYNRPGKVKKADLLV